MFVLVTLLAAAPFTVAAPGVACTGFEQGVCDAYVEHFSASLARPGRLSVRTRSDVMQLLGVERQKQLLGCGDSSCLAELAGGLGVDAVLTGAFTRTESSTLATLKVLRASDGKELVAATARFASARELEPWLDEQVEVFAEKLAPGPKAPPANVPRIALLAGGGVLLAAGAGLFAWSKVDAAALQGDVAVEQISGIAARGRVTQPLGLTLGIVGAACLAGALVWLAVDRDAPAATVAPVPGGGALMSVSGVLPW
ncbi:MAG: hypothetical protein JNK82_19630 [Myxococcaceae bacterium]|nr:hypothetical protein [Myxococcaceae bacterium]